MTLTLASYNMHYGVGQDGRYDLQRIAEAVREADIICLQEVTQNWPQTGHEDQLATIATGLNRYAAFGEMLSVDVSEKAPCGTVRNRRATFGNAVLSRWPILHSRAVPLPKQTPAGSFDLQRILVEAVIAVPGLPLRVYSVHLSDLSAEQRGPQVDALRRAVAEAPVSGKPWDHTSAFLEFLGHGPFDMPVEAAVLGDFNFGREEGNYGRMLAPGPDGRLLLRDAWEIAQTSGPGRTFALDDQGEGRIDYCLLTPGLEARVERAWVDSSALGSDHYPLFVTLRT